MRRLAAALLPAALLAPLMAADLPRPSPPLQFVSHTGQLVKLADLKGKVVIVEFLLTHCPTCQESARILSKLQAEYGAKGLQVLGLAIDQGAGPKIPDFISKTRAIFPIGVYNASAAVEYLQFPVVVNMLMPQVAILDKKGIIREQHGPTEAWMQPSVEEMNMRKLIVSLLAESAAAPTKTSKKK